MLRSVLLLVCAVTFVSSKDHERTAFSGLRAPVSTGDFGLNRQGAIINYINRKQSLWEAGKIFDDSVSEDYLRRLVSARVSEEPLPLLQVTKNITDDDPESFDARTKWPKCLSISHIQDQGNCGSCWAVSVASVIADRTCIASDGKFTSLISAQEIMSCCKKCGRGCEGGWPTLALEFYRKHGVVTGGDFESNEGCMPYEVKPCSHHTDGKYPGCGTYNRSETPACRTKCSNPHYTIPRKQDRHFGAAPYEIGIRDVKHEISHHGPVIAIFYVYEDFFYYRSGIISSPFGQSITSAMRRRLKVSGAILLFTGIYTHEWGKLAGLHAVRVIGWGKENGVGYWLVTNSWNEDWGDRGLFKIKQGVDEVRFEERFIGASVRK